MSTFTVLFLAALLIATGMRLWLATRHVQHIQAHRNAVPAAFAQDISLEAHQKAADYSSAKTRLNIVAIVFEAAVEAQALAFVQQYVPAKASPMCGNSICQDRRFLARWMPALEDYFHYRNMDVSSLKELARRWKPELIKGAPKEGKHEALADVYESIGELKYYREHFIRT